MIGELIGFQNPETNKASMAYVIDNQIAMTYAGALVDMSKQSFSVIDRGCYSPIAWLMLHATTESICLALEIYTQTDNLSSQDENIVDNVEGTLSAYSVILLSSKMSKKEWRATLIHDIRKEVYEELMRGNNPPCNQQPFNN